MANDQPDRCLKCGALLENQVLHADWHAALEKLLPGLETEVDRNRNARRPGKLYGF